MLFLNRAKEKYLKKQKKIAKQEANWQIEKENLKRRNQIESEYKELTKSAPNKLTASKKALIFLFFNCTAIEVFTCWVIKRNLDLAFAMGLTPDLTPLVALIGTIVGEVIGLAAYYAKSTKENTAGGIVYDSAAANNFIFDDHAVG